MRRGLSIAVVAGACVLAAPVAAAQGQCQPPKGVYTAQAEFANATYLFTGQLLDSVTARDARDLTLGNVARGATYAGATQQYVLKVTRAMLTEPPQCDGSSTPVRRTRRASAGRRR